MSNIENSDGGDEKSEKVDLGQSNLPENKVQAMFQELEIMAMKKR